ncbi:MAG: arginine-tRNA-protein transferase [Pyrinomonadaceae bacterium]
MILDRLEIINEEFYAASVKPVTLDTLLADAWRHFGTHFFRYNFGVYENEIRRVIPLRIHLADLKLSKSQRRVLRRNADLETKISPFEITSEIYDLFDRHKQRFKSGVPNSIYDFVARDADTSPSIVFTVSVRLNSKLVAASFFDIGKRSISSIYGIFDPEERTRSLGIFTMLKEIEFAIEQGKEFYYHGYAYEGESYYDYKKRFTGLEQFDWNGNWSQIFTENEDIKNV